MSTIFVFLYIGCTMAPLGEYDWTVRMQRRCSLMSNYFDQLFFLLCDAMPEWHMLWL